MKNALRFLFLGFAILLSASVAGQDPASGLVAFEKEIENAIVSANIEFLKKAYAEDFHFKHSSGVQDSKTSWLAAVAKDKGMYISRTTDSVDVEIHGEIGVTHGSVTIVKTNESYTIRYVRIYRQKKKGWEMIMNRSVGRREN